MGTWYGWTYLQSFMYTSPNFGEIKYRTMDMYSKWNLKSAIELLASLLASLPSYQHKYSF